MIIINCDSYLKKNLDIYFLFFEVWSFFLVLGGCSSIDVIFGNVCQFYLYSDYFGFIQYGGFLLFYDEYENRLIEEDLCMLVFFDFFIECEKENFCFDLDDSMWEDLYFSFIF